MAKKGKKYIEASKLVQKDTIYTIENAVDLAKKTSVVKFDASVDVSFRLNVDPRHADQQIRGTLVLPHGTGKTKRILAITSKVKEAETAGADFVGGKEMIEKIQKENWFDYDVIVATPDMMVELGKIGRLLGPKGLMPNPKVGTVSPDITKAISEIKAGKVEYRVDKEGNIHVPIGRVSFAENKLVENYDALKTAIIRVKPAAVKGAYIKNIVLTTTMGPGIKLNIN